MPDTLPHAARETRRLPRSGARAGHTSGQAADHVQGSVAIVPDAHAADFKPSCRRNAHPCPVPAMSQPGRPHLPAPGGDLDIRTDLMHTAAPLHATA